ncbi:MAG: SPOR domain-containing protein [Sphaerochaetaceae bacterium]|nr:SPOR domain-containing protein [Sphaerochaetaceae bacterium]
MATNGEEFIKNLKAKQEKDELEQRINELNAMDTSSNRVEEELVEEEVVDLPAQELGDILLSEKQNPADKKKYIILGLSLVALFILTIVIIRVISSPSTSNEIVEEKIENIPTEDKLEKDMTDIEKQYQDIINEKLQNLREDSEDEMAQKPSIDIKEIEKREQEIDKPQNNDVEESSNTKQDLFEMEEKPEPVVKPKTTVQKSKPQVRQNIVSKPHGYFIQIGAFSSGPSKTLLDSITKSGFKYVLYDVVVKGTKFTKVLIGNYSSKAAASRDLDTVRTTLRVPGAYILYLK